MTKVDLWDNYLIFQSEGQIFIHPTKSTAWLAEDQEMLKSLPHWESWMHPSSYWTSNAYEQN